MKKFYILIVIIVLLLMTGCSDNSNVSVKEDNVSTLTCTYLFGLGYRGDEHPYIEESKSVVTYKDNILTSWETKERFNYSYRVETMIAPDKEDADEYFDKLKESKKCNLGFYDSLDALVGSVKECSEAWEDYMYYEYYSLDVQKLKEKEEFQTIESTKDYLESHTFKCEIQ